jgi:CRISPR-associated endonuclease/helicase Cas3
MYVDSIFPVHGTSLNADHNYYLFSALCQAVPEFHTLEGFSFNTINGLPDNQGVIKLGSQSILRIRLPLEYYKLTNKLHNKRLIINRNQIELGTASYQTIKPKDTLTSRIVTIKGAFTGDDFVKSCQRQLQNLNINSSVFISRRLTVRITKGRPYTIVGFTTILKNLTPDDSVKVQELGLGGKRRLGCGVFV